MTNNIPIYRAKKIDSEEYVEGYLIPTVENSCYLTTKINRSIDHPTYVKVDPSTLQISFDNSKSWIKLSDIAIHTCTDFNLQYSDMKMRTKKEIQPPNGSIFTIITDKGR
jgi:hypothetical protein